MTTRDFGAQGAVTAWLGVDVLGCREVWQPRCCHPDRLNLPAESWGERAGTGGSARTPDVRQGRVQPPC